MAYNHETDHLKRKRDVTDDSGSQADRIPRPPPPQSGNSVPIDYFSKPLGVKLKLIQGDGEAFSDVLRLMNEYEGVLNRHESLAFNLGAKLTGSRLLKAMEGAFEGAIITTPPQNQLTSDPVTWIEIVEFARSHPQEFHLSSTPTGLRCCQFSLKGAQVEIGEDDWRIIVSGALDRFRLFRPQPLEQDERVELATLEIIEQRLQVLIKRADEVARRARQLNYRLGVRKAFIHSHCPSQPSSTTGFQPVNCVRKVDTSPGYDLHADLLRQFAAPAVQPSHQRASAANSVAPTPKVVSSTASPTPRNSIQQRSFANSNRPSPVYTPPEPTGKPYEEENRKLVIKRIEKIVRGDAIKPPCDRCRRLKTQCIKYLTACQGCTKKHTKCTWKKLTEDEVMMLKGEVGSGGGGDEEEDESRNVSWKNSFASPPQLPGIGDLGAGTKRSTGEFPANYPGLLLTMGGRPTDDMWRKGPNSLPANRMSNDPTDTMEPNSHKHQIYSTEEVTTSYNATKLGELSIDSTIRQVASAASARADAAVAASREG
ncbi:hypothetical protein GGR50DRAFT_695836 [Xylaria sp. CBS 124048]|nr:hypothetical protein GGR50DRAFT_695836 [Xylaria sp. CBS 124048]